MPIISAILFFKRIFNTACRQCLNTMCDWNTGAE